MQTYNYISVAVDKIIDKRESEWQPRIYYSYCYYLRRWITHITYINL
jgi:hypothetical protein